MRIPTKPREDGGSLRREITRFNEICVIDKKICSPLPRAWP